MAAPITHVVLAQEFLKRHPEIGPARDFIVGASFPDIRHFVGLPRELMHDPDASVDKILSAQEAFLAGIAHHAWVDRFSRPIFIGLKAHCPVSPDKFVVEALKFMADETLYKRETDWAKITESFQETLRQERAIVADENQLRRWHELISDYTSTTPNRESRRRFIVGTGRPTADAEAVERHLERFSRIKPIVTAVEDIFQNA